MNIDWLSQLPWSIETQAWQDVTNPAWQGIDRVESMHVPVARQLALQMFHLQRAVISHSAQLAAHTPRPTQRILLGGMLQLSQDLDWFEKFADRCMLDLREPAISLCDQLLASIADHVKSPAWIDGFVTLAAYHSAWLVWLHQLAQATPMHPLGEFAERTTTLKYIVYVQGLVDTCRHHANEQQQAIWHETIDRLADFWRAHSLDR